MTKFGTNKATVHGRKARGHRGSLPHVLRKALAIALADQRDANLLKYNGKDRPTFRDVLLMVGGSKATGKYLEKVTGEKRENWPVSKAMFEYLVNDKYIDNLPPSPSLVTRHAPAILELAQRLRSATGGHAPSV